jgi:hypothetical protein
LLAVLVGTGVDEIALRKSDRTCGRVQPSDSFLELHGCPLAVAARALDWTGARPGECYGRCYSSSGGVGLTDSGQIALRESARPEGSIGGELRDIGICGWPAILL